MAAPYNLAHSATDKVPARAVKDTGGRKKGAEVSQEQKLVIAAVQGNNQIFKMDSTEI